MSLSQKTIVVTRDINQSGTFINILKSHGANVLRFPVIKILGPRNPKGIRADITAINSLDWIIFTSSNAVKFFIELLGNNHTLIHGANIASVGKKTTEELNKYNIKPELVPEKSTSQDLLKSLQNYEVRDTQILLPVSRLTNRVIEQNLIERGAQVHRIEIYDNIPFPNPDKELLSGKIYNNEIDCITFFSPSAVNSFVDQMDENIIEALNASDVPIAVIGPTTAEALRKKHLQPAIVPAQSDEKSLLRAMMEYWSDGVME